MGIKKQPVKKKRSRRSSKKTLPAVQLSKKMSDPVTKVGDFSVWIYGESGIGKTTLTAQFPRCHHFMFEPGAKALKIYQKTVTHWLEWVAYLDALVPDSKFSMITVDVLEEAFELCFRFMCQEVLYIEHPNDENDYGKSWGLIYTEFMTQMKKAMSLPNKGCIFISHATEKDYTSALGDTVTLIRPDISNKILNRMIGAVDIVAYMYGSSKGNMMRVQPDGSVLAKVRPPGAFLTSSGEKLTDFSLGRSEEDAYKNFNLAFNNRLSNVKKRVKKVRN